MYVRGWGCGGRWREAYRRGVRIGFRLLWVFDVTITAARTKRRAGTDTARSGPPRQAARAPRFIHRK